MRCGNSWHLLRTKKSDVETAKNCIVDTVLTNSLVFVGRLASQPYEGGASSLSGRVASLPDDRKPTYEEQKVRALVAELFDQMQNSTARGACSGQSPLSWLVKPGSTVLIKPNWVHHENPSGGGTDCLVTHFTVIGAVLELVLKCSPGRVIVGDAPIQGCDLPKLFETAGYNRLKEILRAKSGCVEWKDFRRTVRRQGLWLAECITDLRPLEDYVLFDLGCDSLLEPISRQANRFRVTMYDPRLMQQAHGNGRHQYLIAKDAVTADVVINLPKLKTHKKAGITGALKNLVGINGNKDYLPHHRLGGSKRGGDCYCGGNIFKLAAEHILDAANKRAGAMGELIRHAARIVHGLARLTGADRNLDGSWYGNDTVWRMCLDLNRILLYGRSDGTMATSPQRTVITLTDAIVCGEGDGPLAPLPFGLGMLTLAANPVAAEYVHSYLMGFDWSRIPVVRNAFGDFKYPLCRFKPEEVEICFEGQRLRQPWSCLNRKPFDPPSGWAGHCERSM